MARGRTRLTTVTSIINQLSLVLATATISYLDNPNPNPMKTLYGESLFVAHTVCVNHVVEKVVSSAGGTAVTMQIYPGELSWKPLRLRGSCGSFHGSKT